MKLVNLKGVQDSDDYPSAAIAERPDYPYGTKLCLNDAVLDALGIEKLPEMGAEITLTAKVKVVARSEYATDGDDNQSLDLQITEMALDMKKAPEVVAKEMYKE